MNLADRLRPYIQPIEPDEPMVSADPIRMFLFRWMIETGDPIEVVAKGFDLDVWRVSDLIVGRVNRVGETEMAELRQKLLFDSIEKQ